MSYFRAVTTATEDPDKQNGVVMGRRTWESIPPKFRPLNGRTNIVLTRNPTSDWCATVSRALENPPAITDLRDGPVRRAQSLPDDVHVATSLDNALKMVKSLPALKSKVETLFVIGGSQVYAEALQHPETSSVHLTRVEVEVPCDTFIPDVGANEGFALASNSAVQEEKGIRYRFQKYEAVRSGGKPTTPKKASQSASSVSPPDCSVTEPGAASAAAPEPAPAAPLASAPVHEELQYLQLVREIMETGVERGDRTGTGTRALFGKQMRFNLRESFPLLTTKRVFWRGVAEELLWFVKGCTDGRELSEKGIKIWDGNGSREYLDKIGLTEREEGDLGPVYGFQWRHFGAQYVDRDADYTGQGFDQLADVIHKIKNTPNDRRIIMSAWNPAALKEMALPPCHMFCQFFVANGEVSCLMYQRSCDMGLGVPFNIASYSLLTRMIAQVCDLKPGDFIHIMGDSHVYLNHIEPLKEQLERTPRPFPTLNINPEVKDIDGFQFSDFGAHCELPRPVTRGADSDGRCGVVFGRDCWVRAAQEDCDGYGRVTAWRPPRGSTAVNAPNKVFASQSAISDVIAQ